MTVLDPMEFELQAAAEDNGPAVKSEPAQDSSFSISSRPLIDPREDRGNNPPDLPRSYGTQTLCLMARDPYTLFAYWDIDWSTAFREDPPKRRAVLLRVIDLKGVELSSAEVEPMAGNCYCTVPNADAAYLGEIGYFDPPTFWNRLASSEVVTTPADAMAGIEEEDFATVPFHLSFQHMLDLLRISKQENASLTSMLAELRAAAKNGMAELSAEARALAGVVEHTATQSGDTGGPDCWTPQRIERIFGVAGSSPSEGFGGPNPNPGGGFPGSSRAFRIA